MARTRQLWNGACAAAALIAIAVAQPVAGAKPGLADRIGQWGGTWPKAGARNEVRIDGATSDEVHGTFCGVRNGDGSVFFYDFDKVKAKAKAGSVELKRGKHTHWVSATAEGVELGYRRKNKKRHNMALEQGEMQCIGRITPAAAPLDAADEPGEDAGMVGVWSAYDDRGKATEVRLTDHSEEGARGTVCYVRKDDSVAFFDFGPGARIEADTEGGRVTIERKPFKYEDDPRDGDGRGRARYLPRERREEAPTPDAGARPRLCRGRLHPQDTAFTPVRLMPLALASTLLRPLRNSPLTLPLQRLRSGRSAAPTQVWWPGAG